jgi:hypothetical protein
MANPKNIPKAYYRVFKSFLGIRKKTTEENRRLLICKLCAKGPKCPECGCLIKAIVAVEEETCPRNKWN